MEHYKIFFHSTEFAVVGGRVVGSFCFVDDFPVKPVGDLLLFQLPNVSAQPGPRLVFVWVTGFVVLDILIVPLNSIFKRGRGQPSVGGSAVVIQSCNLCSINNIGDGTPPREWALVSESRLAIASLLWSSPILSIQDQFVVTGKFSTHILHCAVGHLDGVGVDDGR